MRQRKGEDIRKEMVREMGSCLEMAEVVRDWSNIELKYYEELCSIKERLDGLPLRLE